MENIAEPFLVGGYIWPCIIGNGGMKDISSLKGFWGHNCDCDAFMYITISLLMALLAAIVVLAFTSRESQ